MNSLPVDAVLPQIVSSLLVSPNLVLVAPPGAGKTTRVPPALLDSGLVAAGQKVLVLEPRRVAARAAARRIAAERGWAAGQDVGWQIRFERNFRPDTRLLFLTEGVLVQRMQNDPFLEGIGAIVFDEFHERSLFLDLSLALARRIQLAARPDLRLLAMSATLEPGPVAAFLDAPSVESAGRLFPIAVDYLDRTDPETPLATLVARAVRRGLDATDGDLLVFLPGIGDIRRAEEALAPLARERGFDLELLYGDLPSADQDRLLARAARRRVVLATNIAESSITLDGVTGVVDSGFVRELAADPASGLERLTTVRISRASAEQRAGRAGRQAPGWCQRLWSEHEHRSLQQRTKPEIGRADLTWTALQLHAWGESDLEHFPWFEAPASAALAAADAVLRALGALDSSGSVTGLGRQIAKLPLHPRLAKLVLAGEDLGIGTDAALVAALLSERDTTRNTKRAGHSESDLLDALDSLRSNKRSSSSSSVFRTRDQIFDIVRRLDQGSSEQRVRSPRDAERKRVTELDSPTTPLAEKPRRHGKSSAERPRVESTDRAPGDERLLRAVAAAFLDRLCVRREPGSDRAVMAGGRGVRLARESAVRQASLFVAVEIEDRTTVRTEALVRRASAVEREWLPQERIRVATTQEFDQTRERVVELRRTLFDELPLDEKEVPITDQAAAANVLETAARAAIGRVLPHDDKSWTGLVDRIHFLNRHLPELEWRPIEPPLLFELLSLLSTNARSFDDLRRAPWRDSLLGTLTREQQQALDGEAPEFLSVPSGSRIRIDYSDPERPVLAARIQELFGLAGTPRIARGRVAILLHLLAPNGRPQQVTDDLASFWNRTYPDVRKELAGRYPKHSWPLDPWTAQAERKPRRRTS